MEIVVVGFTLARITQSVVTGQAPVIPEWNNTLREK